MKVNEIQCCPWKISCSVFCRRNRFGTTWGLSDSFTVHLTPYIFFSLSLLWGRRISRCSLPPSPCLRSNLFRSITSQSYLGCFCIMANMGLITEDTPAPRYKGASPKEGLQPLCAGGELVRQKRRAKSSQTPCAALSRKLVINYTVSFIQSSISWVVCHTPIAPSFALWWVSSSYNFIY